MQDTALKSNNMTTGNALQGETNYWVWTPPKETTAHDKEISEAVIECLRLFAQYGRVSKLKEARSQPRVG